MQDHVESNSGLKIFAHYKPIRKCTSKANAQQFNKTDSASIICPTGVLYYI